jgi:uncharacterized OB-fold protein
MATKLTHLPPLSLTDPAADQRTQPFWDAAKDEQLVAPRCANCEAFRMPPTIFCPVCMSTDIEYIPLPGTGTVYSFTVVRTASIPAFEGHVPFIPAAIDADEAPGMRFVSNIVDSEPEDVCVGMKVRVAWHHVSDTLTLPFWAPA